MPHQLPSHFPSLWRLPLVLFCTRLTDLRSKVQPWKLQWLPSCRIKHPDLFSLYLPRVVAPRSRLCPFLLPTVRLFPCWGRPREPRPPSQAILLLLFLIVGSHSPLLEWSCHELVALILMVVSWPGPSWLLLPHSPPRCPASEALPSSELSPPCVLSD